MVNASCRWISIVGITAAMAAAILGVAPTAMARQSSATAVLTVGEWAMTPIRSASTGAVTGILAVKDAQAVTGDNLSVVAYRKATDGAWSSCTWLEGPAAAIAWLEAHGEAASIDDLDEAASPPPSAAPTPVTLVAGVLEDDPAVEAVSDPVVGPTLLSMLASIGYPAANVPVSGNPGDPQIGPCSQNAILEAAMLAFQSSSPLAVAAMSASLAASCEICIYWTFTNVFAWSEWSCGAWSLKSGPRVLTACTDQCEYQRPLSRTRTRDVWTLHWDCSSTLVTQTQTESGWQYGTCTLDLTSVNCVSGALPCPPAPACDLSAHLCAAGPDSGVSRSGWN